ncbi:hypothetical protein [Achromobacter phage shaaii_LB5]|nr:hypothetical protein [Achromobacter phage shaaii_LB5]
MTAACSLARQFVEQTDHGGQRGQHAVHVHVLTEILSLERPEFFALDVARSRVVGWEQCDPLRCGKCGKQLGAFQLFRYFVARERNVAASDVHALARPVHALNVGRTATRPALDRYGNEHRRRDRELFGRHFARFDSHQFEKFGDSVGVHVAIRVRDAAAIFNNDIDHGFFSVQYEKCPQWGIWLATCRGLIPGYPTGGLRQLGRRLFAGPVGGRFRSVGVRFDRWGIERFQFGVTFRGHFDVGRDDFLAVRVIVVLIRNMTQHARAGFARVFRADVFRVANGHGERNRPDGFGFFLVRHDAASEEDDFRMFHVSPLRDRAEALSLAGCDD